MMKAPTSPQRKAPRRTRERILDRSLQLFNEIGEPNVTAAAIADDLRISPGNLYYHFDNKEAIVTTLFEAFDAEIGALLDAATAREIRLEDVAPFLHLLFGAIWRYRFVYRDINDLLSRHRSLELGLQAILRRKTGLAALLCQALTEAGELSATPAEAQALATNLAVVATGWLPFEYIHGARRFSDPAFAESCIARGVAQMLALLHPWLPAAGRERLAAAAMPTPRN